MNQEDIIRMVREAGWSGIYTQWREPDGSPDWTPVKESLTVPVTMEQIERFAALVAAHEREACAKVCEEVESRAEELWDKFAYPEDQGMASGARQCTTAIRARSKQ
jgi:hypothetical protein